MKKAFTVACIILEAIPEDGVASGTLYAMLMAYGIQLPVYDEMIRGLCAIEALNSKNHYLRRGKEYERTLSNMNALANQV